MIKRKGVNALLFLAPKGEGEKQGYFYECSSHWDEWSQFDDDNYYSLRFTVYESKWLFLVSV